MRPNDQRVNPAAESQLDVRETKKRNSRKKQKKEKRLQLYCVIDAESDKQHQLLEKLKRDGKEVGFPPICQF